MYYISGKKIIKESPFVNTYGRLILVEDENGDKYLEMGDCFGPDYFGPLSDEQVKAFYLLCELELENA